MQKYRVLKPYPKQITNSGRMLTLSQGKTVYLKKEAQVLRLIQLGFLKPVVELPKKPKKEIKPIDHPSEEQPLQEVEYKRKSKSEYLSKK